jgi:ribosomal protein S14
MSKKNEIRIRLYKLLMTLPGTLKNNNIDPNVWKYLISLHLYYKSFSSLSRTRKSCALTGRTRAVYRSFQLSRMKIRENIGYGFFFGISKSS